MAQCSYCGSTILLGGVSEVGHRYCGASCAAKGRVAAKSRQVPDEAVRAEVARVHAGRCPKCGGAGPVDLHTSYRVWSAAYITRWSSRPQLSCRRCGNKARGVGLVFSLVLGWWGFPWGVLLTPVQIVRNAAGMFRRSEGPSPELAGVIRTHLASQQHSSRAGAA